jgi:hypothetical protein
LRHFGFIPNEPFFHNSAVAWDTPDMKVCLRTKQQVLEYVKEGKAEGLLTRSGKKCLYVSLFKTSSEYKIEKGMLNASPKAKAYYIVRHPSLMCSYIGKKAPSIKEWSYHNPFFNKTNSYLLPMEELENVLTDDEPTDEERIAIGKWDEAVQALNEEELDKLLATGNEANLREYYEYQNGELIIDTFAGAEGEVLYQPRKKDSTWLKCVGIHPFMVQESSLVVLAPEALDTQNLYTGKVSKGRYS